MSGAAPGMPGAMPVPTPRLGTPGMRPPVWAAREAMLAQGTVTHADIDRWGAALERSDKDETRPTVFAPVFIAIGRKP